MSPIEASKSVLIEVVTILGIELENIVVVGGWVPELVFPNEGHSGSYDVDLALDARTIQPKAYESIKRLLGTQGYSQASEMPNRFHRAIKGTKLEVKLDLITGQFLEEFPGLSEDTHIPIQDLRVVRFKGLDLAFRYHRRLEIEGVLPEGGHNRVTVNVPTLPAFICIKAITLGERMKQKDAYDIYFCVDKYNGGTKRLAAEFGGMLDNELINVGLRTLADKFERIESIGPVWAAKVAEEATAGTAFDLEFEQRRAFELVNDLLREIEVVRRSN
jgi:hypothetical protein